MKIGILTASRTNNNGTDLQAYAMQELLGEICDNVEIINYKCEKLENSRKIFFSKSLRGLLLIPQRYVRHNNHEAFRNKHFHYSSAIYDKTNLQNVDYDMIIVGSDQIWNMSITGNDLSFFLPFKCEIMKASYAASIGKTDIKVWNEKYRLDEYLKEFYCVSVREHSAKEALAEIGINSQVNLDPLLMVSAEKWNDLSENLHETHPFVFVYAINRNKEAVMRAKEIAKYNGYKVVYCGNPLRIMSGVCVKRTLSISEWLWYMKNAKVVITNSYHGLSFAINYHKDFVVHWLPDKQSNTRLENLLDLARIDQLPDGIIYSPDWDRVEEALNVERKKSFKYLESLMETCNEKCH